MRPAHHLALTVLTSALTFLPTATLAKTAAADTEKPQDRESVRVRFVCAVGAHPLKYRYDAKGIAYPYYEEGSVPPDQIFYKDGNDYKRVCLNENAQPGQGVVATDKKGAAPTVFYIRKITTTPGAEGAPVKTTTEYTPLVSIDGLGGKLKDALVCLYNPDLKAPWCPPKTMVVDVGPGAIPENSVMIVNLSSKTAAIRIGTAKPVVIKPGEHQAVAPGKSTTDRMPFKLAIAAGGTGVGAKTGFSAAGDNAYATSTGSRQVLTLFSTTDMQKIGGVDWFVGNL